MLLAALMLGGVLTPPSLPPPLPPLTSPASAASSSVIINFTGPLAAGVTCTVQYPTGQLSFVTPVAVGTRIAVCSVTPTGWSGILTPSGADASFFAMNGLDIVVGAAPITVARVYNITITASP